MLTGKKIIEEYKAGNISIDPFDESMVGPNSYDLHWGDEVCEYLGTKIGPECVASEDGHDVITDYRWHHLSKPFVDMKSNEHLYLNKKIDENGYLLRPNHLYLISTMESVGSKIYVPQIVGRSSVGRLGIQVSQHAAFGDVGYFGKWTLQVSVKYPTAIYPYLKVCHVFFEETLGELDIQYNGRYQGADSATICRDHKFE